MIWIAAKKSLLCFKMQWQLSIHLQYLSINPAGVTVHKQLSLDTFAPLQKWGPNSKINGQYTHFSIHHCLTFGTWALKKQHFKV